MLQVCTIFGGISPVNIYDIEYRVWLALAVNTDAEAERQRVQAAEMRAKTR